MTKPLQAIPDRCTEARRQRAKKLAIEASRFTISAMIELHPTATGIVLTVRVLPRSNRNAIEGERQGALTIRLTAPPIDDRANDALRQLLAGCLNVSVSAVRIVSGKKSRTKRIEIAGVTRTEVLALLNKG